MKDRKGPSQEWACGMRGPIPANRLACIHFELPASYALRGRIPYFENLLIALPPLGMNLATFRALLRLFDGWRRLSEARIALVEAEACKAFYEEVEPDPTEAKYACRFYLDDAALRLCSSCEHLLRFVGPHWNLQLSKLAARGNKDPCPLPGLPVCDEGDAHRLLVRTVQAAEKSPLPEVRRSVAKPLRKLCSSRNWRRCVKYRNDWVHNELPGIAGLSAARSFRRLAPGLGPSGSAPYPGQMPVKARGLGVTVGRGWEIGELRRTVRGAYLELFRAYEHFVELPDGDRTPPSGSGT